MSRRVSQNNVMRLALQLGERFRWNTSPLVHVHQGFEDSHFVCSLAPQTASKAKQEVVTITAVNRAAVILLPRSGLGQQREDRLRQARHGRIRCDLVARSASVQ